MPNNYIKSLVKKGKGSTKELEGKWKDAKQQAKKQDQDDNYAYINSIFKKMIQEMENSDIEQMKREIPNPEFEQLGTESPEKDMFNNHLDKLSAGKYKFNIDDSNGNWKSGDIIEILKDMLPKKEIAGKTLYDVPFNNITIYICKDFITPMNEEDGGAMVTTSDVAGYETPLTMKTHRRGKPDTFWTDDEDLEDENELDEDEGTDFSMTWAKVKDNKKRKSMPPISKDITKKLKIHSPMIKGQF